MKKLRVLILAILFSALPIFAGGFGSIGNTEIALAAGKVKVQKIKRSYQQQRSDVCGNKLRVCRRTGTEKTCWDKYVDCM